MKKIFILVALIFFSETYARSSGPGGWMVADPDLFGNSPQILSTGEVLFESEFGGVSGMEISRELSISTDRPFGMEYSREMDVVGW